MIAKRISEKLASGSMIRKMFEEGNRLKAIYGPDAVYDFSIGNPDLEPPVEVRNAVRTLAMSEETGIHAYMSNSGHQVARDAVASHLSRISGLPVDSSAVCMTVGAAGAMNAVLRSVLDPGDEVIVLAPFFMEYLSYIDNHDGKAVVVRTDDHFQPDLVAVAAAITARTKAIIVNSPNNPSGVIYDEETLHRLDQLLLSQDHLIHIISDEPYAELAYNGKSVPSSLAHLTNVIVCYSWSKSLSLPGERIGYAAVSPRHADKAELSQAIVFCNRILGSVNAPAFFQRVIETAIDAKVDVANYEYRMNLLYDIVTNAGFRCQKPDGALYLFPKAPEDDVTFAANCAKHNLLVVPGSAFLCPGYFRLAFCVSEKTIRGSEKAFREVGQSYGLIPS